MKRGFTLIETVIYIALLCIVLGAAISSAYTLSRASARNTGDSAAVSDGMFVIGKIEWALAATSSAARIITPTRGAYANSLSRINPDGARVDICLFAGAVRMREGRNVSLPCADSSFIPITSSHITASALHFYRDASENIEASTTLNGVVFQTYVAH